MSEEELKQEISDIKKMLYFLLDEVINTHKELKRGSCSPDCPKCNFYRNMRGSDD